MSFFFSCGCTDHIRTLDSLLNSAVFDELVQPGSKNVRNQPSTDGSESVNSQEPSLLRWISSEHFRCIGRSKYANWLVALSLRSLHGERYSLIIQWFAVYLDEFHCDAAKLILMKWRWCKTRCSRLQLLSNGKNKCTDPWFCNALFDKRLLMDIARSSLS